MSTYNIEDAIKRNVPYLERVRLQDLTGIQICYGDNTDWEAFTEAVRLLIDKAAA